MKTVLKDSKLCTGCGACAATCSTHAIVMMPDEEGFLFPRINEDACTHCGLCERICPVNPEHPKDLLHDEPLAVYAAWNRDEEIRRLSSSGGVFTALAESVLAEGGAVVGAAFDEDFNVQHVMVETKADLARLRGSKYVQSEVSPELYTQIRGELHKGRKVLFSGTPCQVAGMRTFLKKQEGVLYVDILCHGVPSPLLWEIYRRNISGSKRIFAFSFRDKSTGWKNYSISFSCMNGSAHAELSHRNVYMQAFLRDLALRQACYSCPFARKERIGDLTLADFWGIKHSHPQYDDDRGTSLVLANTKEGHTVFQSTNVVESHLVQLDDALYGNPIINGPSKQPEQRESFYLDLVQKGFRGIVNAYSLGSPPFVLQIITKFRRRLKALLLGRDIL